MTEYKKQFIKNIQLRIKMGYYLHLPKNYNQEIGEKWPLIIFLHGAGERGNGENELYRVKKHGITKYIESNGDIPFIVICPQCPENSFWTMQIENLNFLLDEVINDYKVDTHRIYLTGMSMGGYGTWYYAMAYPDRFAAIAPICGGGLVWNADVLKNIPVWAFHGEEDTTVPYTESEQMVKALQKCGGNVKFTSYPDTGHDAWTETYKNEELYKWFLKQKRG